MEHRVTVQHVVYVKNDYDQDIATAIMEKRHGILYLSTVWTHPDHRRSGISTQVMNRVIQEFGHQDIALVAQSYAGHPLPDEQLLTWYARFGFELVSQPGVMIRKATPKSLVPIETIEKE